MESDGMVLDTRSVSFDIYVTFEDRSDQEGFLTGVGLSFLIFNHFTEHFILFDTGSDGEILCNNIEQLDVEISKIDKVFISHNHPEHTGGLKELYKRNPDIEIFVPSENEILYRRAYDNAKVIGVSDFSEVEENIYTTGQMGNYLKEQALFLKNYDNEIIIIVGCSHPGLDDIIYMAKSLGNIKAIIGGFHGFRNLVSLEGIDIIGACHCTQHLDMIKNRFPDQLIDINVGQSLPF